MPGLASVQGSEVATQFRCGSLTKAALPAFVGVEALGFTGPTTPAFLGVEALGFTGPTVPATLGHDALGLARGHVSNDGGGFGGVKDTVTALVR